MSKISAINTLPSLQRRFIVYGSRSIPSVDPSQNVTSAQTSRIQPRDSELSGRVLDSLANLKVPHGWFFHFYLISVASSVFWAHQALCNGSIFQTFSTTETRTLSNSMTLHQVKLAWVMMLVQGSRRLYEELYVAAPSKSSMWVVHWCIGVVFYLLVGVAVWIEGAGGFRCMLCELVAADVVSGFAPLLKCVSIPYRWYSNCSVSGCYHHVLSGVVASIHLPCASCFAEKVLHADACCIQQDNLSSLLRGVSHLFITCVCSCTSRKTDQQNFVVRFAVRGCQPRCKCKFFSSVVRAKVRRSCRCRSMADATVCVLKKV